jgi:hypothetical protein
MKRVVVLFASVVMYCLAVVPAHADSVPNCTPGLSIASLQASGGCESGSLLFTHFQYNNSGLQISPGDFVTSSNILVTATPFSVTFSTDYGINGGFTNCGICQEEAGSIGFDVSVINGSEQIAGLGLFGGVPTTEFGGRVSEIGCLGAGNTADVQPIGSDFGVLPSNIVSSVCPTDPSSAVLLNGILIDNESSVSPSVALFSPVSNISLAIGDSVPFGGGFPERPANVTPFTDAFLLVPVPVPPSLMLLIPGILALVAFRLKKAAA